ncbi:MAG: hypothetical protein ACI9SY_000670 [Candidatus Paceibacteria bacterium]|jgi:hypothetical protein
MRDWFSFRTAVQGSLIFVCLLFAAVYIAYQARFLIIGPQITLSEEVPMLQNSRQITLTGSASNISRLWLNGRPIFTDRNGTFTAAVILENGYTVTTLMAEDRYGRTTTITRPFVYTPASFVNE